MEEKYPESSQDNLFSFSFVFLVELRIPKIAFEIYRPLVEGVSKIGGNYF